jgi:hypothetical protein
MATEVIDAGSSREAGSPRKRTPGPSALHLACDLPPGGRKRRTSAVQDLFRLAVERQEYPRGLVLVFHLSDQTARAVLSFLLEERRCCRRFRYDISFEPGIGTFSLTVEAPAGNLVAPLKALYSEVERASG